MRRLFIACVMLAVPQAAAFGQGTIRVASWNIENLGGSGRGFGSGFGSGSLGSRSDADLDAIASFIKDDIQVDLIAAQEIAITHFAGEIPRNSKLAALCTKLGSSWTYYLGSSRDGHIPDGHGNIFCAFIYNKDSVTRLNAFSIPLANIYIGKKHAFDRQPLVGYFEINNPLGDSNDFLLINVHLASGQNNDENHLAAMVILEQNLTYYLGRHEIKESDRIILGDFNDNPYAVNSSGGPRYTSFLYEYMAYKKYRDLVTNNSPATRMNIKLTSVIDHVLINNSADRHIDTNDATVWIPPGSPGSLAAWRQTYSDHFPVIFEIKKEDTDDDVDW